MLGNFSFGDYFKEQAIQWAWQLLTEVYGIPKERLCVSVLHSDQEAYRIWRDVVGVPVHRIARMSEADNFWASGPTGPCGPCSEIYYDFAPECEARLGGLEASEERAGRGQATIVDLSDDERFIELYNLVFMEFNRDAEGRLSSLSAKNIDTGMGLERIAQVLQGVPNNYETDLMRPLLEKAAELSGRDYLRLNERERVSAKIVADHARAVVHLLADGVRPSNLGRGYVLRRLIRRMVRHGRVLGIDGEFIQLVTRTAVELAADAGYLHVAENRHLIEREVGTEESRFLLNLVRGESLLESLLEEHGGIITGEDAFELYDTYGFPVEMTQEIAAERGVQVDMDAFERCMEAQRTRARESGRPGVAALSRELELAEKVTGNGNVAPRTEFVGYERDEVSTARIVALMVDGSSVQSLSEIPSDKLDNVQVILDQTPFYAEGGGQVADTGELRSVQAPQVVLRVADVQQLRTAWIHAASVISPLKNLSVGDVVIARIDAARRRRIRAHHTGTHLLQAALRHTLGADQVAQAGSLVDAERLRFDFRAPRPLTDDELQQVSDLVNRWIDEAHPLVVENMPYPEAIRRGAIAMFGEKYGDIVRVVDVPGVSTELCGGTHVGNTAQIGLFHILSESSISSGVRRIEAVCGQTARELLRDRDQLVRNVLQSLRVTQAPELLPRVESLLQENRTLLKQVSSLRAELASAMALEHLSTDQIRFGRAKPVSVVIKRMDQLQHPTVSLEPWDHEILGAAADAVLQQLGDRGVVVLAAKNDQQVVMVGRCTTLVAKERSVHMGRLLQMAAKQCQGGGGGKPTQAQAGGRDATQLDAALAAIHEQVSHLLAEA
jgi:alanyl-tRNA synthetase